MGASRIDATTLPVALLLISPARPACRGKPTLRESGVDRSAPDILLAAFLLAALRLLAQLVGITRPSSSQISGRFPRFLPPRYRRSGRRPRQVVQRVRHPPGASPSRMNVLLVCYVFKIFEGAFQSSSEARFSVSLDLYGHLHINKNLARP
jgi:hypothetical protein